VRQCDDVVTVAPAAVDLPRCYATAVHSFLQSLTGPVPEGKPRFRGVSHLFGAGLALLATLAVVGSQLGQAPKKALAVLIFGTSMTLLLTTSATYHCINWKPGPRAVMRRLDHSAIFLLIAGGWTPLLWLIPSTALGGGPARLGGYAPLLAMWAFAVVGVGKSMLWPGAPRWVTAGLCVVMGWMAVGEAIRRAPVVGAANFGIIAIAGVTYSLGAVVYAAKRPDPAPAVFGYHEVFHALVLVASAFLFVHVLGVLAVT